MTLSMFFLTDRMNTRIFLLNVSVLVSIREEKYETYFTGSWLIEQDYFFFFEGVFFLVRLPVGAGGANQPQQ